MLKHAVLLTVFLVLLSVVCVGTAGGADFSGQVVETPSGQVIGSPDIEIVIPESEVVPGESNEVEFHLLNEGDVQRSGPAEYVDRVTTARSTTVEFTSRNDDIEVVSGRIPVGSLQTGEKGPYTVVLDVDEEIEEGDYRISANVKYSYTRMVDYGGTNRFRDTTRTRTESLSVEVGRDARFRSVGAVTDARIGEKGDATVTLLNHGSVDARDAVVTLSSPTGTVSFENGASEITASVGDVDSDTAVEVGFPLRFSRDANVRRQSLRATVRYKDEKGIVRESRTLTPSFTPDTEQRFEMRDVSSGLRSGTVGWLSGELVNTGGEEVEDVVLRHVGDANVVPRETAVAVGDLGPGEARDFTLRVGVPSGVSSDKELVFVPEYTRDGDEYEARRVRAVASVAEHRDEFRVRGVDATVTQGDDETVEFEVENGMDEAVRNVTAVAVSDEPAEIESGDAFVGELSPGETATVEFDVSTDSDATPRAYPVRFTFGFTDIAGETRTATGVAPVEVVADESAVPFEDALLGVVVLVLLLGLGWWVYGKDFVARRGD
ncbi:MAG: hypothetical protein U5J64_08625 [Halobacteriales archaeon]|nr:hypothetical protein [Halobacteriales archaeon]